MSTRWQRLPTRSAATPPLLYKFTYTTQSYGLFLTDLTYVWYENLDYKHILQKAEEEGTSIDPSEDINQYGVFMQKIQDALQGANKQCTVSVTPGHRLDSLTVKTSTGLPAGLKALKWTFVLMREPPSAVTQNLVLPLLKSELEHDEREQSLLERLREKDNVLSKVFDKIDPAQLAIMFPGTVGAHQGTKLKTSDLIRHIKGAARFDEEKWRGRLDYGATIPETKSLAESMSKFLDSSTSDNARIRGDASWWEGLISYNNKPVVESPKEKQTGTKKSDQPLKANTANDEQETADEDMMTEDEDEFQRQETPPHLEQRNRKADQIPVPESEDLDVGAGTTESDQADKSTDEDSRRVPAQKEKQQPKKAVGVIGGSKTLVQGQSRKARTTDDLEESDLDNEPPSDSEPERGKKKDKPTTTATTTKQKGGLGRIGGKKSEPKISPSPEAPNETETDETDGEQKAPSKPLPTSKKLGTIGGGKKKTLPAATPPSEHDETDDDLDTKHILSTKKELSVSPKSPSPIPQRAPVSEPEPELSAEQKANQKREELKRQLDAKSKAPTKKKRKF